MIITKTIENKVVRLALAGRLDTITSGLLATELESIFEEGGVEKFVLDFFKVDYMSSAGLRVIINAQKKVNSLGLKLEITGVSESIKTIFDVTGFTKILTFV